MITIMLCIVFQGKHLYFITSSIFFVISLVSYMFPYLFIYTYLEFISLHVIFSYSIYSKIFVP